jgi:hypothetical protein
MSTLFDYEDVEALQIREIQPIHANDFLVGWGGPSNRDRNVLVSHRHRYEYPGGDPDFFRICSGYTYDTAALAAMKTVGANRIAVYEVDTGRVFEFDVAQYRETEFTSEQIEHLHARTGNGEINTCVPVDEALHSWDVSECRILNKDGKIEGRKN